MHPTDPTTVGLEPSAHRRADAIDDVLDRLSGYGYVDGPGMATHGPMGAEALSSLGHDDLLVPWVEQYKALNPAIAPPPDVEPLDPGENRIWRAALGDHGRLSDWNSLFTRQLQELPWQDVVQRWVPRLLPGYGGAFTHGLIRTAHGVRTLQSADRPSPLALGELAKGLAYWAGSYKALPGQPSLQGARSLDEAIARLPRPDETWTPLEAGLFSRIDELPGFAEAVEALGPPPAIDQALSDLTATFARIMLANPDVHPFGLVHAVTPVSAARTLLPYLPAVSTTQVYAQLWQVNAAITAGFTTRKGHGVEPAHDGDVPSSDELVARAVEHRDPHVLKFTEACVRENALRPDPAYLLAALHVIEATPAWD